jgi:hypothetical protein
MASNCAQGTPASGAAQAGAPERGHQVLSNKTLERVTMEYPPEIRKDLHNIFRQCNQIQFGLLVVILLCIVILYKIW